MKFFQKRAVAVVVLILAIVAGVAIGQAKKPDTGAEASTAIVGSYTYVYDYAGVLTDETMEPVSYTHLPSPGALCCIWCWCRRCSSEK